MVEPIATPAKRGRKSIAKENIQIAESSTDLLSGNNNNWMTL
jgi:hypothetical protein